MWTERGWSRMRASISRKRRRCRALRSTHGQREEHWHKLIFPEIGQGCAAREVEHIVVFLCRVSAQEPARAQTIRTSAATHNSEA